jgi:hypothetical protein
MIYFREKITRSNRIRQIANVSQRGIEVEPITPTEMLTLRPKPMRKEGREFTSFNWYLYLFPQRVRGLLSKFKY